MSEGMHPQQAIDTLKASEQFNLTLQRLNSCKTLEQANSCLTDFQKFLDKQLRHLAFEAHPDRGGDEEDMKKLTAARNSLKQLKLRPRIQVIQPPTVVIIRTAETSHYTTTTTTNFYARTETGTGVW